MKIKHKFKGHQGFIHPWREINFDSLWNIVELLDEAMETELMEEIDSVQDLCEKLNDKQVFQQFYHLLWNADGDSSEEDGRAEPEHVGKTVDNVVNIFEFYEKNKLKGTFTESQT